jgi:hypothetical protein
LLHSGKLDLDQILLFLEGLFQTGAILLPGHELELILELFFTDILHLFKVLIQLRHFNICVFNLFFSGRVNLFNLFLVLVDGIISDLLILLFKSLDLILQLNKLLR